jgi:hypothetical protein
MQTGLCPYRWGQATAIAVPVVFTAGSWAAVKAGDWAGRLSALFGNKADDVAKLIAEAEKLGYTIAREDGKVIIRNGDEVTTIAKNGDELVVSVGKGGEKLWTKIDEIVGDFNGHPNATYYDINVTYQPNRPRVGVAFEEKGILEFHLNIPEQLQGQGLGTEIFKRAIDDYSPSKVKGWWKKSDIYTGGESINLTIFKQKISEGFSPQQAAFETPTGKILKANGFEGTVEIIQNTSDEVIIYFNPKK